MPINPMQPIQEGRPKPGKLDTVAQAIDIATKVLGTGIEVYNAPLKRRMMQGQEEQTKLENDLFPAKKGLVEAQLESEKPATEDVLRQVYQSFPKEDQPNIDIAQLRGISHKKATEIIAGNVSDNPKLARDAAKEMSNQRLRILLETSPKATKSFPIEEDYSGYGLGKRYRSERFNSALEDSRADRLERLIENDTYNFKKDRLDKFNGDFTVRKATEMRESAGQIIDLVDMSRQNPIAAAAIPTFMARASGEVGSLSEADKRPFGGSRAMAERIKQAFEQFSSGTLTAENAGFVRQLATKMQEVSERKRYTRAAELARSAGKIRPEVSEKDLLDMFVVDAGLRVPAPESPPPLGKNSPVDFTKGLKF